jgi:carbon-monoxide dehydrogenase large subunit
MIDREGLRQEQAAARERGRYIGLGFSAFIESTGVGSESSRVELLPDGTISVAVGSPSTGQSHETVFAQIAADRLGVDLSAVRVVSGDSGLVSGTGTFASRMALDGGNAVALAAGEVRERVLALAADLLEASPGDLEIEQGVISVRGYRERGMALTEVMREAGRRGESLCATRTFEAEHGNVWAGGANAAVVEVDVETGLVAVLRYVVAHDSGVLVNPAVVEGQVQGAVAHGIGNVLLEACDFSQEGQPLASTFADYLIPSFGSVPEVEMIHFETPSPFNPEGIKGAGESGTIGALPTLASAIENALEPFGVRIDSLPVRPEQLLERITAAGPTRQP